MTSGGNSVMLQLNGIYKDFAGLRVLTGVNLAVRKGERHAIIGPNGAGKTTLFNIISGKFEPSSGSMRFKDRDITGKSPHNLSRLGIGRSFQITNLFQNLTVFENVVSGVRCHRGLCFNFFRRPEKSSDITRAAEAIIDDVGLNDVRDVPVSALSYGRQRALEIGVTLSIDPELILLDEPTAGMTREETAEATRMVDRVTSGRTLVIIEHDMDVVFSLADTISVLHYGCVLVSGTPEEIKKDQRVKDAYLGEE